MRHGLSVRVDQDTLERLGFCQLSHHRGQKLLISWRDLSYAAAIILIK
jgi:hypothetical protein